MSFQTGLSGLNTSSRDLDISHPFGSALTMRSSDGALGSC